MLFMVKKRVIKSVLWGELPRGLRCCNKNGKFPVQTPLGAWPGLGTQPRYEAPGHPRVETE